MPIASPSVWAPFTANIKALEMVQKIRGGQQDGSNRTTEDQHVWTPCNNCHCVGQHLSELRKKQPCLITLKYKFHHGPIHIWSSQNTAPHQLITTGLGEPPDIPVTSPVTEYEYDIPSHWKAYSYTSYTTKLYRQKEKTFFPRNRTISDSVVQPSSKSDLSTPPRALWDQGLFRHKSLTCVIYLKWVSEGWSCAGRGSSPGVAGLVWPDT